MSQTTNKYQIIQKISADDTVLLHPETDAEVVEYSNTTSGLDATTVQGAIDKLAEGTGVTAVKGNAETSFRQGQVNLTADDIGAEEVGAVETHNNSSTSHSDIRTAISTAQSKADSAYALAEGKSSAVSFSNISAFITSFNSTAKDTYKIGDNIYIQALNVPDLWVYSVESSSSTYSYTSDDAFISALNSSGSVQVGYYKVSLLETDKVDLTEYQKSTDNSLTTTSKTIVGAINEVKTTADTASSKATENATSITNIVNGTTQVASAVSANSATTATSASKLITARTLGVSVNSGTKVDGSTSITGSGTQSFDGSANKTISVTLGDSGVTAGTYSAIQVNSKGVAIAGGQIIEVGTSSQTTPSTSLATGGLFFKMI